MNTTPPAPRYYTFWSINGPLQRDRLRRQLADFKAAGLHGVVFHPRYYCGIPPYLSDEYLEHVTDTIRHARELGLRFWLYDENGWPSGTGDGKVLAKYPDSGAIRLDLSRERTPDAIGEFHTDAANRLVPAGTPGAQAWYPTPRKLNYVDSLNPAVLDHFLELIHERYRTGLPADCFDYIEAIFFDEPESGMIKDPFPETAGVPWSPVMPARLQALWGDAWREKLPLLFAAGDGAAEARIAFWENVTDTLIAGFFAPYQTWCEKHGKQFIGHVKGEEHPLFQLPMVGSCHRIFRHLSMPGIDALERFPSLDYFPRQAGSFARQFGAGRAMVECFGGSGWGASPEDLERYLLWLGRNGLTDFVFHLSQYRLDTPAITDWPPSEPLHLSWKDAFPAVLDRVSRELTAPRPAADTLVVAPYRGLMAVYEPWELMQTNMHNAATAPDTPATRANNAFLATLEQLKADGIAFDLTDERTLESDGTRLPDGRLRLGQAEYTHVVIDPAAILKGQWREVARGAASEVGRAVPRPPSVTTAPTQTRRAEDSAPYPSIPLAWQLTAIPDNAWLLTVIRTAECTFTATLASGALPAGLTLHFADDLIYATFDVAPLVTAPGYDGTFATLPALTAGEHSLTFKTAREVPGTPFVWLKGPFTLRSQTPYTPGPTGTIKTDGPFIADAVAIDPTGELVAAGLPFAQTAIEATATFRCDQALRSLTFPDTRADALQVQVDDTPPQWIWGPDWRLELTQPLSAGEHRLRVGLVPSTFNHFGPHHYYNGDWPVVSPDQVTGRKNFADLPDAPDATHVPQWHFKPVQLPTVAQA
ncbi:MAG: hypothetical protein H7A44_13190 [Opitutaceae bacterium]|nr:hypothetical protein [Opitutaceae bacterium]